MAISLVTLFFVFTIAAGVVLCAIAVHTYRTWNQPGTSPFVAFVLVIGAGTALTGVLRFVAPALGIEATIWGIAELTVWAVSIIPWIAFGLQYTGTYTRITRRTVVLLVLPACGFPFVITPFVGGIENPVTQILGSLSAIYLISGMTISGYLLLRTAKQYGHLSLRQGAILAVIPLIHFLTVNFSTSVADSADQPPAVALYAVGIGAVTVAVSISLYRYETFQSTPAVGTIGERAIVRQTEDLMFVVDDDERVTRLNRTAADRLDVSKTDALGDPLSALIGVTIEELSELETIELMTDEGSRQFDPVISPLTDQHGRQLGHTLSLHDVTELELREQRLEVLNRVLRHNLRNQVEVIKSNAEFLAEDSPNGYADSIIESADRLTELGRSARSIDQIVSQPSTSSEVDVAAVVRDEANKARTRNGIDLELSAPEEAVLTTERHALVAAAESATESALSRASQRVTVTLEAVPEGYCLRITDDGPGIPEEEIESVAAGTETALQHATGLGLWQLKWAVTKFNGDLTIENGEDGTTIEIRIPDQGP